MQDEGVVGWDPISITRIPPWQEKLLMLFLMMVSVVMIFRLIRIVVQQWRADKNSNEAPAHSNPALIELQRVRRWAKLTILVTALAVTSLATSSFRAFSVNKIAFPGLIFGTLSELAWHASAGLTVATVVLVGSMVCEWWVAKMRRRAESVGAGHSH